MSFDLTQKVKIVNPHADNDELYGTYPSIQSALAAVPMVLREKGRKVGVIGEDGGVVEYWFKYGISDEQLIPRDAPVTTGGPGGGTPTDVTGLARLDATNLTKTADIEAWKEKLVDPERLSDSFAVTKAAGSFDPGETFPAGMTWYDSFKALLTDTFTPNFEAPSASLVNNAGAREAGEVINLTLTSSFGRGVIRGKVVGGIWQPNTVQDFRAGLVTSHVIDGTTFTTSNVVQPKNLPVYEVLYGPNSFTSTVNYLAGPQPLDSAEVNFGSPLPAGNATASTTFVGQLRTFVGSVDALPTSGAQIRTKLFGTSILGAGDTFSFGSGTVNRMFVIAIPANKSLISAVNSGTNETLIFNVSAIQTVPDAGGTNRAYKVYTSQNAVAFSSNYRIDVKVG